MSLPPRAGWIVTVSLAMSVVFADVYGAVTEPSGHALLSQPHEKVPEESREVCAYCHFPPGGVTDRPGWKRNGNDATGRFQMFATTGITSPSDEPVGTVGSVSLACLSCHDGVGVQGIDVIHRDRFSHPVSIPYAGGNFNWDPAHGDPDAAVIGEEGADYPVPEVDLINRDAVWWIETGGLGRQKTDLQLYTRLDADTGLETPYVECSTCHDPHRKRALFLRQSNDRSRLCTTCHRI